MRCSACPAPAVVDQPYRARHLCEEHLVASVVDRFGREMHRQWPRFRGGTVAVALSGGKDSAAALALAHGYFAGRPGVSLVAITVDEGIAGYRPATVDAAGRLTSRLGVEHVVVRAASELGTTTDRAARALPHVPPCSYCGVWRRRLLNRAARDVRASVLLLGFNLDDLAQTVLMNVAHGEIARLARMAPHRTRQAGLIPRIAPLAQVPEREVFLFARARELPFDHGECPHAGRAERNRFREIVWQLEEARPGTRQALLQSQTRIAALFPEAAASPGRCRTCGDPSVGALCRACAYLRELPTGPEAA